MPIPLLVFGDGPTAPTGLGRITTDLARHLHAAKDRLGIEVYQIGWSPHPVPEQFLGAPQVARHGWETSDLPWRCWHFTDLKDWGRTALHTAYRWLVGDGERAIILTTWDPSRCFDLIWTPGDAVTAMPPATWWGYFPIDGTNINHTIGGPARIAIEAYDRVTAPSRFGCNTLASIRSEIPTVLPHGIDLQVFRPDAPKTDVTKTVLERADDRPIIGVVATNQPRKDFGLVFHTLSELRRRHRRCHLWIHTDEIITEAWSIPQLAEDFSLADDLSVTTGLNDVQLASLYARCAATIAPGRGEGFGYPIVESLACGTPVVHANYAGGAEYTPMHGRVNPTTYHLVGPYAIRRPILSPTIVADKLYPLVSPTAPKLDAERRAMVEHLDWPNLWPSWEDWVRIGLEKWSAQHGKA